METIVLDGVLRVCKRCGVEKPLPAFPVRHGDRDGEVRTECRSCYNKRCNFYKKLNPEKQRAQNWKNVGIINADGSPFLPSDFEKLLRRQTEQCAICKKTSIDLGKVLFVDHSHTTKIVRGLLCFRCNSMIGLAKDNPEILRSGAHYLG